jgi:hypothetical protein
MASASATSRVVQVQIPNEVASILDDISNKTHVPKAVILRMGVERIVADIQAGKVQLGISFGGGGGGSVASGPAPAYAPPPPPPPPVQPTFVQVADPAKVTS